MEMRTVFGVHMTCRVQKAQRGDRVRGKGINMQNSVGPWFGFLENVHHVIYLQHVGGEVSWVILRCYFPGRLATPAIKRCRSRIVGVSLGL